MPAVVIAALSAGLALLASLGRPRLAFATVIAATVLIPDTLVVPLGGVGPWLTVHLLVTAAAFGGVVWRSADGRAPVSVWRPTGASLALSAYLLVAMVVGLALAAPQTSASSGDLRALDLSQQVIVLITCVALVREDGEPLGFVWPVVGVLAVSSGIGVIEHVTGDSWGHFLFSRLPSQSNTPAAFGLQDRDGTQRVRAGADFALSFAAVSAAMLAMLFVQIVLTRRVITAVGLIVIGAGSLAAIYWSGTRSALVAMVVLLLTLGLLAGRRWLALSVTGILVLAVVGLLISAAVAHHFSIGVDQGSVSVRQQRIPVILGAVAGRPFTGIGLSGLSTLGVSAVDSSYLLAYGETGALGLAALLASFATAFCCVARGLWTRDRDSRLLISGSIAAMAAIVVSAFVLDAVDLPSVIDVFWELAAIGIVAGELSMRPERLGRPVIVVVVVVGLAALFGGSALISAPKHYSTKLIFFTLPTIDDNGTGDIASYGDVLITRACNTIHNEFHDTNVSVSCTNPYLATGQGDLIVSAPTVAALQAAIAELGVVKEVRGLHSTAFRFTTLIVAGRPSGLITLPASLAVAALILAIGLPLNRRERAFGQPRRRRTEPSVGPPGPAPLSLVTPSTPGIYVVEPASARDP